MHRDLSLYNFRFYRTKDGIPIAVLIDFDLSSMTIDDLRKLGATSKHRTGTAPFMARHLLRDLHDVDDCLLEHLYVFDLESWFCIFLHMVLGCGKEVSAGHPLLDWFSRNLKRVLDAKGKVFAKGYDNRQSYLNLVSCSGYRQFI